MVIRVLNSTLYWLLLLRLRCLMVVFFLKLSCLGLLARALMMLPIGAHALTRHITFITHRPASVPDGPHRLLRGPSQDPRGLRLGLLRPYHGWAHGQLRRQISGVWGVLLCSLSLLQTNKERIQRQRMQESSAQLFELPWFFFTIDYF